MEELRGELKDGKLILHLCGHIDSGNAANVEAEITKLLSETPGVSVGVDASELNYISSAGLRVLLHVRKLHPELSISDVSSDVYEILEMTGFTQMMSVEKAYRRVSIEGCEEIGRGAKGTIYRIDKDNVVKVYNNADALEEIQHEREVARIALVLGIPTAISYDVVKVGDSYGSVFELLDAQSFSKIIAEQPDKLDWCVNEYSDLLKKIHGTLVPEGQLPNIKPKYVGYMKVTKDHLPQGYGDKLVSLVEAIPEDNHMIHGDYHTKNVELVGDEVLLIDMDTLAVGHPIFELSSMYNAYVGFSERDHNIIKEFQGFDFETSNKFWHKVLARYLGTDDEAVITDVENKARIISYGRLISRVYRKLNPEDPECKADVELWTSRLLELLDKVDTLDFSRNVSETAEKNDELDIEATNENLYTVLEFVDKHLEAAGCSPKAQMQIDIAVEEIFVNIASYAYHPGKGNATVRVEVLEDPIRAIITFVDKGIPYDPLAKEDPDITLPAEERGTGGLGIFMTKEMMDDVTYEYKDGQNILTLHKNL